MPKWRVILRKLITFKHSNVFLSSSINCYNFVTFSAVDLSNENSYYRWVKRTHLGSNGTTKRVDLQSFVENQIIRTKQRTDYIERGPSRKRNLTKSIHKYCDPTEQWKLATRNRQPKYLHHRTRCK